MADLNIDTFNGRVMLTGTVPYYWTKEKATAAAYRVSGVRHVENEMTVNPSEPGIRSDRAIADSIKHALLLDYQVPDQRINVQVNQGHVTLTGSVEWAYQRQAAVDDVLKITGVTSVDNQITFLNPPGYPVARSYVNDDVGARDQARHSFSVMVFIRKEKQMPSPYAPPRREA